MKYMVLIAAALLITGCATVSREKTELIWLDVSARYQGAKAAMPDVVWVDRDIYIVKNDREVFVNGAYNWKTNTVYLRKWWADEETVAHEFRHAQGELMGETTGRIVFR